jgi:hypothetical protein
MKHLAFKSKAVVASCMALGLAIYFSSCQKDEYKDLDCTTISAGYNASIKPIINANCLGGGCHNTGSLNGDFTTYAGLKAKADDGSLNKRVLQDKDMPASGALPLDQRKQIKCWLENGALNN